MSTNRSPKYLLTHYQAMAVLFLLFVIMDLCIFMLSVPAGIVALLFTLVAAVGVIWYVVVYRSEFIKYILSDVMEHSELQKHLLWDMKVPYAVIDENGKIFWTNQEFLKIAGANARFRNLRTVFPELKGLQLPPQENWTIPPFSQGEDSYSIEVQKTGVSELLDKIQASSVRQADFYGVYLRNITRQRELERELEEQRLVIGLLYIDNYDEVMGAIVEAKQTMILAHIERKINKYFSQRGSLVRKMESDKFFLIIPKKYVNAMIEDKFYILDDIRGVKIGTDMSLTVSIGLGIQGKNYEANYDYARTAIDMALGRGGDQVVIKDGSDITFVGGQAQTFAKNNTRVKARVKAHAFRELLDNKDVVFIMGHQLPDFDAIGAAVGVYRIATTLGCKAYIVLNEVSTSIEPIVERLSNSSDYPDGLFITGQKAMDMMNSNSVLVVVDTNRGSYTECPELLLLSRHTVVLDHHRQSKDSIDTAVLSYVEPYASSACELVAEVLQYTGDDVKITTAEADAMYAGVFMDTGNFTNKTGVRTFEAAAFLRRKGADPTRVRRLFKEQMDVYRARAEAVRSAEIFESIFAISICPSEGLKSPTIAGAQAADELLNIIGIEASFVLTLHNDSIYISARSIDSVNVQLIMERLGGGGHGTMAGAQLHGCTIEEAKEYLKVTVHQMMEEGVI